MKTLTTWLLLALTVGFLSIGQAQDTYTFALNSADPLITTYRGPCYVHRAEVYHREELVLLLPGKGYQPTFYDQFIIQAGKLGYHGLALKYVDDVALDIQVPCGSSALNNCFVDARMENITGNDVSPVVAINRTNSIEHRLIESLFYLNEVFPGNGWDKFWSGDSTILWEKIRIVGHEEGAGYAATIGKTHNLARVVLMGWSDWDNNNNALPAWLGDNSATPAANWYGFAHTQDEVMPFSRQEASWNALGFGTFGAVTSVDATAHPYNNSHMLSTSITPALSNTAFNDVVLVSSYVPLVNNELVLLDAWSYLIDGSNKVNIAEEWNLLPLSLAPNPANTEVQISGDFAQGAQVRVFSTDGKLQQAEVSSRSVDQLSLNISSLSPGIYLVELISGQQRGSARLMVK